MCSLTTQFGGALGVGVAARDEPVTLDREGRRRAATEGKARRALAATVLGAIAVLAGAAIWLVGV